MTPVRQLLTLCFVLTGVVHEVPAIGSDGESEEASGASDEVTSPVNVKLRQNKNRRITQEVSGNIQAHFKAPLEFGIT